MAVQGVQGRHLKLVLAAYNAGPTKVLNMGRVPHIKETKRYIA
jgi:soluble lytic murein transglycosylase-like protein